ncbi:hypothetical protein X971_1434 [Agrobacterium tumefaciens LBA4213 (Ach5)]|nr:hypothetical protein X971_1434 [Agrobacterium tumefaciens LBA4213 (Ach5)]
MLANGVLTLQYRQRVGGLEQSSKRWLICYCKFRIKFKRRHHPHPCDVARLFPSASPDENAWILLTYRLFFFVRI